MEKFSFPSIKWYSMPRRKKRVQSSLKHYKIIITLGVRIIVTQWNFICFWLRWLIDIYFSGTSFGISILIGRIGMMLAPVAVYKVSRFWFRFDMLWIVLILFCQLQAQLHRRDCGGEEYEHTHMYYIQRTSTWHTYIIHQYSHWFFNLTSLFVLLTGIFAAGKECTMVTQPGARDDRLCRGAPLLTITRDQKLAIITHVDCWRVSLFARGVRTF